MTNRLVIMNSITHIALNVLRSIRYYTRYTKANGNEIHWFQGLITKEQAEIQLIWNGRQEPEDGSNLLIKDDNDKATLEKEYQELIKA